MFEFRQSAFFPVTSPDVDQFKKKILSEQNKHNTRMWANAQRDGRHAEYRWRPLFNAAVWLTPTIYYSALQYRCQDAKPVEITRGAPN